MLTIRLSRYGRKKQPTYRVIISEKSKDTKGKYLEHLGFYNPRTEPRTINLKEDRIKYWISKGAQASDTVHNILVDQGIIDAPKHRKGRIEKKKKGEEAAEDTKPEATAEVKAEVPKEEKKEEQPAEAKPEEKKEEQK